MGKSRRGKPKKSEPKKEQRPSTALKLPSEGVLVCRFQDFELNQSSLDSHIQLCTSLRAGFGVHLSNVYNNLQENGGPCDCGTSRGYCDLSAGSLLLTTKSVTLMNRQNEKTYHANKSHSPYYPDASFLLHHDALPKLGNLMPNLLRCTPNVEKLYLDFHAYKRMPQKMLSEIAAAMSKLQHVNVIAIIAANGTFVFDLSQYFGGRKLEYLAIHAFEDHNAFIAAKNKHEQNGLVVSQIGVASFSIGLPDLLPGDKMDNDSDQVSRYCSDYDGYHNEEADAEHFRKTSAADLGVATALLDTALAIVKLDGLYSFQLTGAAERYSGFAEPLLSRIVELNASVKNFHSDWDICGEVLPFYEADEGEPYPDREVDFSSWKAMKSLTLTGTAMFFTTRTQWLPENLTRLEIADYAEPTVVVLSALKDSQWLPNLKLFDLTLKDSHKEVHLKRRGRNGARSTYIHCLEPDDFGIDDSPDEDGRTVHYYGASEPLSALADRAKKLCAKRKIKHQKPNAFFMVGTEPQFFKVCGKP